MNIYIAADHGGYTLKQLLIEYLSPTSTIMDCGNKVLDHNDDASDFVQVLAQRMATDPDSRGIVICRSGGAVQIATNRYAHLRATAGSTLKQVRADRNDDHINVLALGADHVTTDFAKELVDVFLNTNEDDDPRFIRRVKKLGEMGLK